MRVANCVVVIASVVGCASSGVEDHDVAANSLGVARVSIERTRLGGDPILVARGYDAADHEIAKAELRTGNVLYSPEPDRMPAEWNRGTDLAVTVGERESRVVTPDLEPHQIQALADPASEEFLRLAPVAAALDREAGIQPPSQRPARGERAFSQQGCSGWMHPTTASYVSCCFDGYQTVGVQSDPHVVWTRQFSPYGPCRTSSGSSDCSGAGCTYGPCGFTAANGGQNMGSYYPTMWNDGGEWCNYLLYDTPHQHDWIGVDGTCSYSGCSNGQPF